MVDNMLNSKVFLLGIAPVLSYILGFLTIAIPLEILIKWYPEVYDRYGIHYNKNMKTISNSNGKSGRLSQLNSTLRKISFQQQLRVAINVLFGPTAILNGVFGYFLFSSIISEEQLILPTSVCISVLQLIAMELVGDFFLYWGHRIQHDVPLLWKNFHCYHHQLDTPSPIGTLYIDQVDATLQGALPMMFAGLLCRPNIAIIYLYIYLRVAENVINHSGLDIPVLNILFLKVLPFRASIAHHDSHHKYSNHGARAKNYGENFWLWDYIFGTFRQV